MSKNVNIDVDKLYRDANIVEEAVQYGYKLCQDNKISDAVSLLDDLILLLLNMEKMLARDAGHLVPLAITCCKNMRHSIRSFKENPDKQMRIYHLEIMNLSWNLRNVINKQYRDINNDANVYVNRALYLHEIAKQNKNKQYKYKVSIFVVAYNKLEYTKAAVESIYKYTDFSQGDIELITWNNGSNDETEQYFENLPNEKKINYKYNAFGTSIFPDVFEGRYVVVFSNDVVATPNWLDNLIKCVESDDKILLVVPTCQNYAISCGQGILVDYQNTFADLEKMENFAREYNHSNQLLWEERPLLMPFLVLLRREYFETDLQDPNYTQALFGDDDVSTIYRRAGWKQILAKDTFMHHFGSVTLGDSGENTNSNALMNMRKVYFDKWQVDAWGSRGILPLAENVFEWSLCPDKANILWLDPLFGYDFLKLKNIYKKNNKSFQYTKALISDCRYQQDVAMNFSDIEVYDDLRESLKNDTHSYDIIAMSRYINEIIDSYFYDTVQAMIEKLNQGGWLLLPVRNYRSAYDIYNYISGNTNMPNYINDVSCYNQVEIRTLLQKLNVGKKMLDYEILNVSYNDENIDKIAEGIKIILAVNQLDESLYNNLKYRMTWLGIKKI